MRSWIALPLAGGALVALGVLTWWKNSPAVSVGSPRSATSAPTPNIASTDGTTATPPSAPTPRATAPTGDAAAAPALDRFRDWTARYLAAAPDERPALEAEGLALAGTRRSELAALIRRDPATALAAAVPLSVRPMLPSAVQTLLEQRLSGIGRLPLLVADPSAGSGERATVWRSATLDGREYRAFVFGRRAAQTTLERTALHGIAIDGDAAFAESPVRPLEAGESPPADLLALPGSDEPHATLAAADEAPRYVEAAGATHRVCCAAHLAAFTQTLLALEENHAAVDGDDTPGSSGVTLRPDAAWTHGPRSLLIIRVDFPDLPGTPVFGPTPLDDDYITRVIGDTNGVRDFFAECSYGKTSLVFRPAVGGDSPDVTPVLRLPRPASYYASESQLTPMHDDARAAAIAAGIAVDGYDRVGLVFSSLTALPGSKVNAGGIAELVGKRFWINGAFTFRVVAHELGHTYGLTHSNLWFVKDGDPVSPLGSLAEYGDYFDVMGGGNDSTAHFSHRQKNLLRWLPDEAVAAPTADGVYRLHRFDAADADLTRTLALKLPHDATYDYWLGYRRGFANATLRGGIYGLLGHRTYHSAGLIDFATPGIGTDDAGLVLGTAQVDAAAGVAFQPIAQGGTGADEWIDVQVDFAPFLPQVGWSRPQWYFNESGAKAVLTLRRTVSAAGAVSVAYATQPGTAVASANFAPLAGRVTWADGDTSDKTVIVALAPDTTREGFETFTVTLSDPLGALIVGGPQATVTITEPGTRDPGFNASYSPKASRKIVPLADGGFLVAGTFTNSSSTVAADANRRGLVRLRADGTTVPGFAGGIGAFAVDGPLGSPGTVYDAVLQPDGRILAAGDFISFLGTPRARIVRLHAEGGLDTSFDPGDGPNGAVHAICVQTDGKILLGGEFTAVRGAPRRLLARLHADGALDESFVPPTFADSSGAHVAALALQPDGRILVGGKFALPGAPTRAGVCRLRSDGSVDPAFADLREGAHAAGDPAEIRTVHALAVQLDGRVLVGGDFSGFNGATRGGIVRLTTTGALDASFDATLDGACHALALQPDGHVVIGGAFTRVDGAAVKNLARLEANGALDAGFYADGYAGTVMALGSLPDGRLVFGGESAGFQDVATKRAAWVVFATSNFAPAILAGPRARTLGVGSAVRFTVNATGAPPLHYQWFRDGAALAGATTADLSFAAVQPTQAGNYAVQVWNEHGSVASAPVRLDVRPRALRLFGISTRAQVGTGGGIQIGGFAISGNTPKRVAIRANGPALRAYGVGEALADPVLSLYAGQTLLLQNDNWAAADAAEFTALGLAPWTPGSADAAILTTLAPGAYTAQVAGKGGATGVALIEIYDAEPDTAAERLVGISTRAEVGAGNGLIVGGFVITGDVPKRVLLRASGPALVRYGVSPVLVDPVLTVYSGQTAIAVNDDWPGELAGDFAAAGMFEWPLGSKDAALSLTLPPGAYTAQVTGKNGATGVALIEIYED